MISHQHKFVFIHVPKTGGRSIDITLKRSCDESSLYLKHLPLKNILKKFPECVDYFKFSFVRNPWDRMISEFFYTKKIRHSNKKMQTLSFKEFVLLSARELKAFVYKYHQREQFTYLGGSSGVKELDFMGKFESLQEDFNIVCDKLGIAQQELPHENKTNHKPYTEYYDDETRKVVAEKYSKDIEYFGYEFGE